MIFVLPTRLFLTVQLVLSAAKELKIESYLKVHFADECDLNTSFEGQFDLVWLDGIRSHLRGIDV